MNMTAQAVLLRLVWGILITITYGLAIYTVIWAVPDTAQGLQLISGAVLLSMGIGGICSAMTDPLARQSLWRHIYVSMFVLLLLCLLTVVLFTEGIVCLVMAAPLMIPGVIAGVCVAWMTMRWWQNRGATLTVIALPLLVYPLELQINWPDYQGQVMTEITIDAPPEVVWSNTVEIRDIDPASLRFTPTHNLMFFPRPLDARLDREGPGATRSLTWTSGVHFREHITEWEKNRRLAWTFGFDSDSIPAEVDGHLRPDAEASELLHGDYVLEPNGEGGTVLRLTTYYKVSLPWNGYGRWWADRLLTDFHSVVLDVVKSRAESEADALAESRPSNPPA
ncbi:MAG: SRPBCC family protein [Paracoccus denitrificans]|uniref:SRPBCC family protein n=1 Tax=Paracoccus denitrificans TaxID=266 RepID=A0A533I6T0_PARDE|nr:MAG: SRPBCC family protein [Paracoccus denitrificans]